MVPNAVGNGVVPLTLSTAFTYDAVGRVTALAHVPQTAPALPSGVRLSAIVGPDRMGMAYDANGNRKSVVYTQADPGGTTTQQRVYQVQANSNRLLGYEQTQSIAGGASATTQTTYGYDATGAITQVGSDLYGHGANGRMQTMKRGTVGNASATYVYNALGQRVQKKNTLASPAMTTQTVYADGPYDESTVLGTYGTPATGNATQTEVVYLPTAAGPMPIAAVIDGRMYAIHSDHLNTPRRLTQADGKVAWQWVTTAFGEVPPSTGATGFVQETSSAPKGAATTTPVKFDLRFPGQVADEESGLYYNLNRSYNPATGRYTQNDPIGLAGGWNRYGYVGSNPLTFTDSTGLQAQAIPIAVPIAIGCALTQGCRDFVKDLMFSKPPRVNDPEANRQWQDYKDNYAEPPPPNLDQCEKLKWQLKREQALLTARQAWDLKWGAHHTEAIAQSQRAIKNLEQKLKDAGCQC